MHDLTISELQQQMAGGTLTAQALTQYYLDRIATLDNQVNAIIELNPTAQATAEQLDQERAENKPRGPLHGIPILIKDNIDTQAPMLTTAGSLALLDSFASGDAFLVQQLSKAGAVILGKTNLSEWANFRSKRSISGWSSRGGQTRNAYVLERTPGGSSSGSAAAVAVGFCAAAIGTETDGSIVSPSAMNSIVGIKPTLGLISRAGIIPIAHSQDTAGPMARSIADAASLLGVLAGGDEDDPVTTTALAEKQRHKDYTQFVDRTGLKNARLGFCCNFSGWHEQLDECIAQAITIIQEAGAEIVEVSVIDIADVAPHEENVLLYEFKADLNAYLEKRGLSLSLADIIAINIQQQERVMPYFGQSRLTAAQAKGDLNSSEYQQALSTSKHLVQSSIDNLLQQHKLDALISPTTSPPWLIDTVNGDNRSFSSAYLAAVAGYPSITVPAGYVCGLPVGLSFFASAWQEPLLIKLASAFEYASQIRQPPTLLPQTASSRGLF